MITFITTDDVDTTLGSTWAGDTADDVMNVTDPVSGITFQVALYRQYRQVRYEVGLAWGVASIKPEHGCVLLG